MSSPVSHQIDMLRRRNKLQSEYLGTSGGMQVQGKGRAYWIMSGLDPDSFSLASESSAICSPSHFSRSSCELWGTF